MLKTLYVIIIIKLNILNVIVFDEVKKLLEYTL